MIMRKIILLLTLCLSFPVYAVQYGMRWTAVPPPSGDIVTGYNVCISANDIPVFPAMLNDCIRRSIVSSYTGTVWFGTYTTGGAATYVNSKTLCNTLREEFKQAPDLEQMTLYNHDNFGKAGGVFPSFLALSGKGDGWSLFDPDLYAIPSPQWDTPIYCHGTSRADCV